MKVLFFTNIPSPYRVDFFNELGKKCDLTVLYERCDAANREKSWLKPHVHLNYKAVFLRGKRIGADTAFCPEVIKYWKDKQYDIRIVGDYATPTGILSILYMKSRGIAYGLELDGGFVKDEKVFVTAVKKWLVSGSRFALSPGKTTNQYLLKYGMRKDQIYFYPFTSLKLNDIQNAERCTADKEKYRYLLNIKEKKVILSVGQMIPRKGFDILLQAARYIDTDVGIYIVGGKPPEEYLDFIQQNRLENVHILGFMSKEELTKYYAAADVFVLPTREDIWGLVIEEAMAYGLPVITTTKCVAGIELIADEGGVIVNVEDPSGLSKAIGEMLSDELKMKRSGMYNLIKIKEYTIENMVEYHLNVFYKLKEL